MIRLISNSPHSFSLTVLSCILFCFLMHIFDFLSMFLRLIRDYWNHFCPTQIPRSWPPWILSMCGHRKPSYPVSCVRRAANSSVIPRTPAMLPHPCPQNLCSGSLETSLFHVTLCEDASVNILHLPVDSTLTSSMGRCHGFKCSTLMTELLCRPTVWYMFVTGWNRPWSLELLRCALPPFVIPELSLECGMRR